MSTHAGSLCNTAHASPIYFLDAGYLPPSITLIRSTMADARDITALLGELKGGNRTVVDQLLPYVYEELQTLARS